MSRSHQRSQGRVRLAEHRLRDQQPLPSPNAGATPPGDERHHCIPIRHLTALTRVVAGERGSVESELAASPGAAQLARAGLKSYRALVRELGWPKSPTARAHALTYGLLTAAAHQLVLEAGAAGIATTRGLELLDAATRIAGRAERSSTAALALAGLLDGKRSKPSAIAERHADILGAPVDDTDTD